MSRESVISRSRIATDAGMTETVTIARLTRGDDNPDTLEPTYTTELHYPPLGSDGRARLKFPSLVVSTPTAAGQQLAIQDVTLSLPVGLASLVVVDDIVTVTASPVDADLVGRTFRIKGTAQMGQVSAHRWPIESL